MPIVRWVVPVVVAVVASGASRVPVGPELAVPQGDGAPVITDGLFSPGEWDDAASLALTPSVRLRAKHYRGVVFLGLQAASGGLGPSDLFLAVPGGPISQLHVSAQLGEVTLPASGPPPAFRFGLTVDWYANEQRRDMAEAERLQKAGKSPIEIITATSYPSDGIEFALRRAKFPGRRWLLRLNASALVDGRPGMFVYPVGSAERDTAGWQVLRFE